MTAAGAAIAHRRVAVTSRRWVASRIGPARAVSGLVAVVLLLFSLSAPLWQAELRAPQYPGGLRLEASGNEVSGDVKEINGLNHYVGMRPFEADDIPELQLWGPTVAAGIGLVVVATLSRRRWLRVLAKVGLFAIPVGVLADIQWRLWQYGHQLDPDAALRIDEFTPWVVGWTKVWNFNTVARPGIGLLAVTAAAAAVTAGPPAAGWIGRRLAGVELRVIVVRVAVTALIATLLAAVLFVGAAGAAEADGRHTDHHHHGSEPGTEGSHHAPHTGPGVEAPVGPEPPSFAEARDHGPRPGGDLQRRLVAAAPGDTVVVDAGTYRGPLVIDRPVTLLGRGRPVIDGGGQGDVVVIRSAGVGLSGFHLRNGGAGPIGMPAGVRIEAADVTVEDNVVTDVYAGIVGSGAARLRVVGNVVHGRGGPVDDAEHSLHGGNASGSGDGISLWNVAGAVVAGNEIHHVRDGIYLSYGEDLLVDRNRVRHSRFGLHHMWARHLTLAENRFEENLSGAVLMYGGPVLALRNRITDHRSAATGFGILVRDVADAHLAENVVARNAIGLQVEGAPLGGTAPTRLTLNTVAHNDVGFSVYATAIVGAGGNSFAGNTVQVLPRGRNALDGVGWVFEGTGNYWSDYRGYDGDGDGMGDVPHPIGGAIDRLYTRAPMLQALAGSPALRLLAAVEERFLGERPAALAHAPLMQPHSPPINPAAAPRRSVALAGGGALLVTLVAIAGWWARTPRRLPARLVEGELTHAAAA